jgi:hypothetical protein
MLDDVHRMGEMLRNLSGEILHQARDEQMRATHDLREEATALRLELIRERGLSARLESVCTELRHELATAHELVAYDAQVASARIDSLRKQVADAGLDPHVLDLAEVDVHQARHKRKLTDLKAAVGKDGDVMRRIIACITSPSDHKGDASLEVLKRRMGKCPRKKREAWSHTEELVDALIATRLAARERDGALQLAHDTHKRDAERLHEMASASLKQVQEMRAQLDAAGAEASHKRDAARLHETSLKQVEAMRAQLDAAGAEATCMKALHAATQFELRMLYNTTRITAVLGGVRSERSVEEYGAVRVVLDLHMTPELDPSGMLLSLLQATCPLAAVATWTRSRSCAVATKALREIRTNAKSASARCAYVTALRVYAADIGGEVAETHVRMSIARIDDPILAAQDRCITFTGVSHYNPSAHPGELIRALTFARLFTSVNRGREADPRRERADVCTDWT